MPVLAESGFPVLLQLAPLKQRDVLRLHSWCRLWRSLPLLKSEQHSTIWMDHILGLGSSISGHLGHLLRVTLLCTWCADICLRPCFHSSRTFPEVGLLELPASFNHKCVFTSPAPSRTRSSTVTARGWTLVLNGRAAGLQRPCRVSGHDPLSLCPPSVPQPSFPARSQQGRALRPRVPGAQTEAVQCGAREALRRRQAIPTPGRWRDPPAPWRQGQRSVSTLPLGWGQAGVPGPQLTPRALLLWGPLWRHGVLRGWKGDSGGPCGAALATLMSIGRVGSCPSGMGVYCRDGRGGPGEASTGSSFPLPGPRVGGAGIGRSTGRIQTRLGALGGASGDWFSLAACDIPR